MTVIDIDFVLSIKPEFSEMILAGKKKVELRRKISPHMVNGTTVYIYESSPTKSIVGKATVTRVVKSGITGLWRKYGKKSCVNHSFFKAYFSGLVEGYAIEIDKPISFNRSVPLELLKRELAFTPPQSYMYATRELIEFINS